ncbi:MAG: hypothetical protein U5J95_08030 [Balneolaceae bacterium]|nr:hypothetical protein [Balneolaceae bacterium]
MKNKIAVGIIFLISCVGLSATAQGNFENKFHFKNYHHKAVEFRVDSAESVTLQPGDYAVHESNVDAHQVTVLNSGRVYTIEKGRGNVFFWMPRERRVGFEVSADEFYGESRKIVFTLENDSGREVEYILDGKQEKIEDREGYEYTFEGFFVPKIYIFGAGKTYVLSSGTHKLWWMQKEKRIGLDLNYQSR